MDSARKRTVATPTKGAQMTLDIHPALVALIVLALVYVVAFKRKGYQS